MKKYRLNDEEKQLVEEFYHQGTPFIFRSGMYHRMMQWFDEFTISVCPMLLKGNPIDKILYDIMMEEPEDKIIDTSLLDDASLNYYNNYLKIVDIVKKYNLY